MGQMGRFDKSLAVQRWRGRDTTVRMAIRQPAATPRNTSRGEPWSMIAPKISGAMTPPILKPVVTKPNTLPNDPGGVIARTIMSRDGMITPEKNPAGIVRQGVRFRHHGFQY